MTSTHVPPRPSGKPDEVLAALRANAKVKALAELREVELVVAWCAMHVAGPVDASEHDLHGGVPLAGPGVPYIAEDAVVELSACLGKSTNAGKRQIGRSLELHARLPELWRRVQAGEVPAWRALKIADHTMELPVPAAAWVDRSIAPSAGSCSWAHLERTVEAARVRFDPDAAEQTRAMEQEGRHFTIHLDHPSTSGTVYVNALLSLADAIELDAAISAEADNLARLGSGDTLDVRRSVAAARIARTFMTSPTAEGASKLANRPLRLHVHVAPSSNGVLAIDPVGRCEETRSPVNAEQIRLWCADPSRALTVRPVIDLADHHHVERYEVPAAIREQVNQIDLTCVFPHCSRPADESDLDHIEPYPTAGRRGAGQNGPDGKLGDAEDGGGGESDAEPAEPADPAEPEGEGRTASDNIAPLCRRHHRHKTFTGWRYRRIRAGSYLWISPHGLLFLRDQHGTINLPRL